MIDAVLSAVRFGESYGCGRYTDNVRRRRRRRRQGDIRHTSTVRVFAGTCYEPRVYLSCTRGWWLRTDTWLTKILNSIFFMSLPRNADTNFRVISCLLSMLYWQMYAYSRNMFCRPVYAWTYGRPCRETTQFLIYQIRKENPIA